MGTELDIVADQKKKFALELLKNPHDPYACAVVVFGDDTASAIAFSYRWQKDYEVLRYQEEYREEHGSINFLPDKSVTAQAIWDIATNAITQTDDKLKALRLYAEVRNFIEKPNTNNNIAVNLSQNRVMIVKDHGSDEDWEEQCQAQQMRLVEDATASE